MPLNEWVTDDISVGDGDRTDWKALDVTSTGNLTIEFAADEKDTGVTLAFFDRYGEQIKSVNRKVGSSAPIKFYAKAAKTGRFFLMIRATEGPMSAYSVRVSGKDGGEETGGTPDRPDF